MAYRLAFALTSLVLLLPGLAFCQSSGDDDDDEFRDGLIATFRDQHGTSAHRVDRTVAVAWDGTTPDRRLTAGPLQAEWTGYLTSQAPGEYRLKAFFQGRLSIELDGRTVLEAAHDTPAWHETDALTLPFDYHPLTIRYRSTGTRGQLALFWSGPQFQLEPIGPRQFHHDPKSTPSHEFQRGEQLVHALRCTACHQLAGEPAARRAPALDRLRGNLSPAWLVDWLATTHGGEPPVADLPATADGGPGGGESTRQMPSFGFSKQEAADVAAFLIDRSQPAPRAAPDPQKTKPKKTDPKTTGRDKGRELFLTRGCLACHQLGDLGTASLFGGGDLSRIAAKRPTDFFARWLTDPARINQDHRMPLFEFSKDELHSLVAFLRTLDDDKAQHEKLPAVDLRQLDRGRKLVEAAQCASCHRLPGEQPDGRPATVLSAQSAWDQGNSCLQPATARHDRPGFAISVADQRAIKRFVSELSSSPMSIGERGARLVRENNCLACHPRGAAEGLTATATRAAAADQQLAPLLPAMIPPSLANVGDKLHDRALGETISRKRAGRRDYLRVRMPRFVFSDEQLQSIVQHFVTADRIPAGQEPSAAPVQLDAITLRAAGSRLVTPDGFGCTSCHQIGDVPPVKAPVNARGPNLTTLGDHVRRPWFDRFVRNPARIVPRMEMPSVRVAVHGLLADDVDHQLSAVWDVLNIKDFQPPRPDPVRVVRFTGQGDDQAVMLTDVIRSASGNYLKPLLVGLPNRHSMLFDQATARLTTWSVGDVASQHTEGKTWFWEAAGTPVLETKLDQPEISLTLRGTLQEPVRQGQFLTELDVVQHVEHGLTAAYRLRFVAGSGVMVVPVAQTFAPLATVDPATSGIRRSWVFSGLRADARVRVQVVAAALIAKNIEGKTLVIDDHTQIRLVDPPQARFDQAGGVVLSPDEARQSRLTLAYMTTVPVDRFPVLPVLSAATEPVSLNVVPGYEAVRVPLETAIMPTGLAWRPNGELVVSSLKGRVWTARDTDGDSLEDQLEPFSDELAAPYGLAATERYVDVVNKYGLLRLFDDDGDGRADRHVTIASGWGHTTDYHDWAVGLPSDESGNYYIAIPCQQDKRSLAAAHLRGTVLKLTPREPTVEYPRPFEIETVTAGHRFPMGIALNRDGQLFVTDNQGNYNPFNELNHVLPGKRFGFINAVDRKPDFQPPLTPPAIDIPHPWTRSVNGICFLETPKRADQRSAGNRFGPFEGHLIGCEYDTRRLIRMSLQKVGDTMQGAAYPFSYDEPPSGPPFLGPLVCSVSPTGDLYVGGIRDSGWGGANNVGELVRLRPLAGNLPCGIAEVRATATGFVVDFTGPADPAQAADVANYSLASYTRISTPAYGGNDTERRVEPVREAHVAADARGVTLTVGKLRAGFVYELNLKNLSANSGEFFPAQAHYTMRVIPE